VGGRGLTSKRMMVTKLSRHIRQFHITTSTLGTGDSQPDINLGQCLAKPVRPLGCRLLEMGLGAVEGLKEGDHVPLVGGLGGGEARLVDAVVDLVVLPLVGLVDLRAQGLGVELDGAVLFVDEVVELAESIT